MRKGKTDRKKDRGLGLLLNISSDYTVYEVLELPTPFRCLKKQAKLMANERVEEQSRL